MGLVFSTLSYSSDSYKTSGTTTVSQSQLDEWVEYVLIGGLWFKIIHLDDGSTIIQASGLPSGD